MRNIVKAQLAEGTVNAADIAFADLLMTLANVPSDELWTASALASASVQNGDVCIVLNDLANSIDRNFNGYIEGTDTAAPDTALQLRSALQESGMVQTPQLPVTHPLVLDEAGRLYLARYWQEERDLAEALQSRLQPRSQSFSQQPETKGTQHRPSAKLLDALFPPAPQPTEADWQRVAAVVAAQQQLCVITGGPGTGKTRTVARLLAVLMEQSPRSQRIALLAPTGKAAARLLESLRAEVQQLATQGIILELPDSASTMHRALGYQPGRRGFKHRPDNPLPFDLVLVDEASMVDLSLMYALVSALAPKTRLIMLGDRDQLASVEAGNVLGDIVGHASPERYSANLRQVLLDTCPGFDSVGTNTENGGMADAVVQLKHSYRFDAQSGIGHFARAVNAGDADAACEIGNNNRYPDLVFINPAQTALQSHLTEQALPAALAVREQHTVQDALKALQEYRVLCALHLGPRGVEQINQFIESRLVRSGNMQPNQLWYQGRPILITRNDPGTSLYNGDTGLIWPDDNGHIMAWFSDGEGSVRAVAPGRLPAHQTCYAMTVHKTQGSEFGDVLLILPEVPHQLLSRDLLYTGITRARRSVVIYGGEDAIRVGCETKRVRRSGLLGRLWG